MIRVADSSLLFPMHCITSLPLLYWFFLCIVAVVLRFGFILLNRTNITIPVHGTLSAYK